MESHHHLERLWKGALHAIAIERTGSETLFQHLRQINQEEIHAHFSSAELPVTDGLLASGEPVVTKEEVSSSSSLKLSARSSYFLVFAFLVCPLRSFSEISMALLHDPSPR
jgi:hypothetical protein